MPDTILIPSIEQRISAFIEVNRRKMQSGGKPAAKHSITISREFGCEAYPMAEQLKAILDKKSGATWAIIDKALMDVVAKDHNLTENLLQSLGKKPRWLDEMLSTMTPHWKNEKDHYRLLCEQVAAIAEAGNAIIIGMGGAIVTHELENCFHFRLFASQDFKVKSIARRMKITRQDAELLVEKRQHERDKFIANFLDKDARDLSYYHLIFNNDKNSAAQIAETIAAYVLARQ
jgi:cytidylate kinase